MNAAAHRFDKNALLACAQLTTAQGELFGPGNAKAPFPPLLMMDAVTEISQDGGAFGKGLIRAALQVDPQDWFFDCHFPGDQVMPGCLGLDAMWQLVGFFLGWSGAPGRGRALGVGEVEFTGQVTPRTRLVTYRIDMKRVILRHVVMGIGDGVVEADGEAIYTAKDLKVGLVSP